MEILQFDSNICTSKAARHVACRQHQWKAVAFLFSPHIHLLQSEASGGKERCFCCIFNRAAQFNPTLTFKAQGLIPSLVKAFVWGSPSPLASAFLSLVCPPKEYWQIFTGFFFYSLYLEHKTPHYSFIITLCNTYEVVFCWHFIQNYEFS